MRISNYFISDFFSITFLLNYYNIYELFVNNNYENINYYKFIYSAYKYNDYESEYDIYPIESLKMYLICG